MKAFRKISALLLALLVLVSSTSFMVGVHICMGEIENISLFTKADGCAMELKPSCPLHPKMTCCEDETYYHNGEDFKASVEHITIEAPMPMVIEQPLVIISEIIPTSTLDSRHYYNYDPPLRSCDLTVEHQVFLI